MSGKGCKNCKHTFNHTGKMCYHTDVCRMPAYSKYEENMSGKSCMSCEFSCENNRTGKLCEQDCEAPDIPKYKAVSKAVKFDQGKPQMTLIPPNAALEIAKAMTYGASKYSEFNYLKGGFTHRRLLDSCLRHINAHLRGEDIDESGNTHLANAAASLCMLIESCILKRVLDDRFKKGE